MIVELISLYYSSTHCRWWRLGEAWYEARIWA